jgi:hypothetical protein
MSIPKTITLDELIDKIELETDDSKFKVCAKFLLIALSDWPTMGLEEPKDLLHEPTITERRSKAGANKMTIKC